MNVSWIFFTIVAMTMVHTNQGFDKNSVSRSLELQEWTQLGSDIDGETIGDKSGWSVSLSSDGRTVAIGADGNDGNGTDSGHVRVYHLPSLPTPAPSVSLLPTPAPSVTANPSQNPTSTHLNITSPLLDVSFNDTSNDEIILSYNKTFHRAEAQLLNKGCVAGSVIDPSWISKTDETFNDEEKFKVSLDLKPEGLALDVNKTVFNDTNPESTNIDFCVRVDLFAETFDGEESVTFQQTEVSITANTTQGFEVTDISLETDTKTASKTTSFEYSVTAKQCDREGVENGAAVKQSESVFICVESSEASIKQVKSLIFWGSNGELTAIRDGIPNAVTSKRALSETQHIIQSRLVSRFYSTTETKVTANGAVVMGFAGSADNRRLQLADSVGGDGNGDAGFDVEFKLAPMEDVYEFEEDASPASVVSPLGFLAVGIVTFAFMELM